MSNTGGRRINIKNVLLFVFLVSISAFRLNIYVALPAFMIILLYSFVIDGKIIITDILKWGIVFWGYYFISTIWAHDISDTLDYIPAAVYAIGIFIFLPKIVRDENDLHTTLRIIFYSIVFTAFLTIIMTPLSDFGTVRVGTAIGLGENTFGMRMAIGAMIALFLLKIKDKKMNKTITILLIILLSILSLLSGSKKSLLLLVLGLLSVTFISAARHQRIRKTIGAIIIVCGLLLVVFNSSVLYNIIGSRIEKTFLTITNNNTSVSSLQTISGPVGATDISLIERGFYKEQAKKLFFEHPFLGCGGNNFRTYIKEMGYSHATYSHNNYYELLSTLGVIGFIMYYSYWAMVVVRLIKIMKATSENDDTHKLAGVFLSMLLILLILDYGNVSYITEFNMFLLCLSSIFINHKKKELINETL